MSFYSSILRPALFRLDPEAAHRLALGFLAASPPALVRLLAGKGPLPARRTHFGLTFPNPVGLAAGMDKNARALRAWEHLGFGSVEVGTITARAQPGNPRPRLFRYPAQRALVNRMGFNNDGAEAIARRLRTARRHGRWPGIPVGINIGKSRSTPVDEAVADYLFTFRTLRDLGDYFVINVSSPNTPGLRDLQEIDRLRAIAAALRGEDRELPLLVKIAPDLADDQAAAIAELAAAEGLSGLIATNTTLDHSALAGEHDETGGLSGAPLRRRSTELLAQLRARTALPLIASGGIMDGASAKEKFDAGASLVQIYTGFVYCGPQLIPEILGECSR